MNKCIFTGRLCEEPELKTTTSGIETTTFNIAVNRDYVKQGEERKADFLRCVAWRKTAVFINQYFHKGDGITLVCNAQSRTYEANDGSKRYVTEFIVEHVEFPLGRKSDGNGQYNANNGYSAPTQMPAYQSPSNVPTQTPVPNMPSAPSIEEMANDDDLPF